MFRIVISRKSTLGLLVALSIMLVSGCVTETTGDMPFQEPDEAALERAHQLYVDIAYQHIQNREYDRALKSIAKALEIKPRSALALSAEAEVFHRQGDLELAENSYKKAIRADGSYMKARLNYGSYLFKAGRFDEACEQFSVAANDVYYELRAGANFNLGKCLLKLEKIEEAEAAFRIAVNLDPENHSALYELAHARFTLKDYASAASLYRAYVARCRQLGVPQSAEGLWLGIRIERLYGNKDNEASYGLLLKNLYPYSSEYLEYKQSTSNP